MSPERQLASQSGPLSAGYVSEPALIQLLTSKHSSTGFCAGCREGGSFGRSGIDDGLMNMPSKAKIQQGSEMALRVQESVLGCVERTCK